MSSEKLKKTFTPIPGLNMGLFSPGELARIIELINEYDVEKAKITGGGRLALLGIDDSAKNELLKRLEPYTRPHIKNSVTYVQACPGAKWCKYGVAESLPLGEKLEQLSFAAPLPAKVKVGVAGCRMCCTEPYLRDVGLIASSKGWTLVFGGNGGGHPRIGEVVAKNLTESEAVTLVEKCLQFYLENGYRQSRTARFMERIGIETLKENVLEK